jgi:hypothetical protein
LAFIGGLARRWTGTHWSAASGTAAKRAIARERMDGAQTGGDVLLPLAVDMEREFLV